MRTRRYIVIRAVVRAAFALLIVSVVAALLVAVATGINSVCAQAVLDGTL